MRAATLMLVLGGAAVPLHAQGSPTQKGSLQLAGTAGWSHTKQTSTNATLNELQVSPRVGYFVVRGLALSGNLLFGRISTEGGALTQWGVGPELAYYPGIHSSTVYPFVSARTLFIWNRNHTSSQSSSPTLKSSNGQWSLSGGALFMVGQHVGITGELYYRHERISSENPGFPDNTSRLNTYGVQWGVAAFVF